VCTICFCPLIDPVEHLPVGNAKCSQIYCKKCAEKQQLCPHCRNMAKWRTVEVTPSTQRLLFNPLHELTVVCPRCKGPTLRRELANHLSECSGDRPNLKDKQKTKDTNNQNPVVVCPAADVMCPWKGPRRQLAEDHIKQCPYIQLQPLLRQLLQNQQQFVQFQKQYLQTQQKLEKRLLTLELKASLPLVLPTAPLTTPHRKCVHCKEFFFLNTAPPCSAHVHTGSLACVRCGKANVVHSGFCTNCALPSSELHFCMYCKKPADPKKPCNAHPHE